MSETKSKVSEEKNEKLTQETKRRARRSYIEERNKRIYDIRKNSELKTKSVTKLIELYAFRGNIILTNISDEVKKINNSSNKNKIFISFFKYLEKEKHTYLKYQNKKYCFYFDRKYDSIIHCKLQMYSDENRKISNLYKDIFVDLNSQKILVERDVNYDVFIAVIKNIMNKFFKNYDAAININCITQENEFWKKVEEFNEIKSVKFDLTVPNLFAANNAAIDFLKSLSEEMGATNISINITNPEGNLNVDREKLKYLSEYSSAGGGIIELKGKNEDKKSKTINTYQEIVRTQIELSLTKSNILCKKSIEKIKSLMQESESTNNLKEKNSENKENNNN